MSSLTCCFTHNFETLNLTNDKTFEVGPPSKLWWKNQIWSTSLSLGENRIPTLLPWKECPVRLSPEWRERSMTAALLANKSRLSIGSEREQPGLVWYCVFLMTDELEPVFSVKPGGFICAIIWGRDKGWICDTGWHFHSTVSSWVTHSPTRAA